jgi:hypothetical protein
MTIGTTVSVERRMRRLHLPVLGFTVMMMSHGVWNLRYRNTISVPFTSCRLLRFFRAFGRPMSPSSFLVLALALSLVTSSSAFLHYSICKVCNRPRQKVAVCIYSIFVSSHYYLLATSVVV